MPGWPARGRASGRWHHAISGRRRHATSPEDRAALEWGGSELVVLARAMGHPTRSAILQTFFMSPSELRTPSALASSLEQSTAVVSYNVRVLVKLGILELRA